MTVGLSNGNVSINITVVYTRRLAHEILELWEELEHISGLSNTPWIVDGDFNVILNKDEKLGRLLFTHDEASDFIHCINNCDLVEL